MLHRANPPIALPEYARMFRTIHAVGVILSPMRVVDVW